MEPTNINRLRAEVETLLPIIRRLESNPSGLDLVKAEKLRARVSSLLSDLPRSEKGFAFLRWMEVLEENGFTRFSSRDRIRFDLEEDDPRAWTAKRRNHAKRLAKRAALAASSAE